MENVICKDFKNNHTHINKTRKKKNLKKGQKDTCELLIHLICTKVIPRSSYLRVSAMRISRDEKYIQDIQRKMRKDKNKQRFHNHGNHK